MSKKTTPFIEYFSESTAACLVTMVQGNLLAVTASHLLIASQTGLIAGAAAAVVLYMAKTRNRWLIAGALGLATGVVDFFIHPGMFGSVATEAIVTGLAAAILSFAAGTVMQRLRVARDSAS